MPRETTPPEKPGRLHQLRLALQLTRKHDPRALGYVAVAFVIPVLIGVLLGVLTHQVLFGPILGVMLGVLAATAVFSRRASAAALAQVEGKPGAAAGVVDALRGTWKITPGVQVNRNSDLVHRVVGRPGVILIAEGTGRGPRDLLAVEARRVRRVAGDVPVHDLIVGDGPGEVPLRKLQLHLQKLPRVIKDREVAELDRKLRALGTTPVPVPKGPIPTRVPRGRLR